MMWLQWLRSCSNWARSSVGSPTSVVARLATPQPVRSLALVSDERDLLVYGPHSAAGSLGAEVYRFFFARLVRAFLAPRVGASSTSSSSDSWLSRVCRRGDNSSSLLWLSRVSRRPSA